MALITMKEKVLLFLKGMMMGAADVVPGVSGGTIAFIVGIYTELVDTIRGFNLAAAKTLFTEGPSAAWKETNCTFLMLLLAGIATSVFSLARAISYVLENHPILIWSFFFGLIAASILHMGKQLDHWRIRHAVLFCLGALFVFLIGLLQPPVAPEGLWMVFVSGAIAICAMILPGISGSFILLMLGMYERIINAIKELDIAVIVVFSLGAGLGLLAFSRLLSWLLHKFYHETIATLTGFLLGSLYIIWPWREVTSSVVRHGEEQPLTSMPILPGTFEQMYAIDAQLVAAIVCMLSGIVIVLGLEKIGAQQGQ